jgi:hypothetical protein
MIFIIFGQFCKQYLIENIYARMGLSFKTRVPNFETT